jgi:4-amino-4-deoxy-L-arabinose transferase-like glycosyltransferase
VFSVGLLASRLAGKPRGISQEGFWAAGSLATCLLFVMAGRAATPDACLIAFSTLGITALVLSVLAPASPFSSGRVGQARWIPAMFGYTMLGLAGLAKGPVGIVLPLIVVHAWWMICHRLQNAEPSCSSENNASFLQTIVNATANAWSFFNPGQCFRSVWALRTIPGLLLCLLAAAPWYVAVGLETDGRFLRGFFLEHNLGRAMGSMEGHSGSLLYYPVAFVVGTFPWSLWLIPIIMWCRVASRENVVHRQMVTLSAVWIAVYLMAFSAAGTKLPSYITPCYAGAALVIGGYWRQFESAWSRPSWRMRGTACLLTVVTGLAIAGGLLWLGRQQSMPLLAFVAIAGAFVAAIGVLSLLWDSRGKANRIPLTWLVGAAAFQMLLFGFGAKSVDSYRRDLAMLEEVQQQSTNQKWLAIGGMEPSWVHYLGTTIVEVEESQPEAWQQVGNFLDQFPEGRVIAVGDETAERLSLWQMSEEPNRQLQEVARAPRFLRPGMVRIYQSAGPTPSTEPQRQPRQLLANQTDEPPPMSPSGALPPPGAKHADPSSEVLQNNFRDTRPRTAQANEYSNPLRPR